MPARLTATSPLSFFKQVPRAHASLFRQSNEVALSQSDNGAFVKRLPRASSDDTICFERANLGGGGNMSLDVLETAVVDDDFMKRFFAAWKSRDVEAILSMCTDDVVLESSFGPTPAVSGWSARKACGRARFVCSTFSQAHRHPTEPIDHGKLRVHRIHFQLSRARRKAVGHPAVRYLHFSRRQGFEQTRLRQTLLCRIVLPGIPL